MDTNLLVSKSLSNGIDSNNHEDFDDFVLQLEDDLTNEDNLNEGTIFNGETNSPCKMGGKKNESVPGHLINDSLKLGTEIQDSEKTEEEYRKSNHDRLNKTNLEENIPKPVIKTEYCARDKVDVIIVKSNVADAAGNSKLIEAISNSTPSDGAPSETEVSLLNGMSAIQMDVVTETPSSVTVDNLTNIKIKVEDNTSELLSSEIMVEDCNSIKREEEEYIPLISNITDSHNLSNSIDEKPKIDESFSDLQLTVCTEHPCEDSQQSITTDFIDSDINENSDLGKTFGGSCKDIHRKRKGDDGDDNTRGTSGTDSSPNKKIKLNNEVEEFQPNLVNGFKESITLDNDDVRNPKKNRETNNRNNIVANGHSIEDEVVSIIKKKKTLDKNERMQARLEIFNSFYSNDNTIAVNRDILEEITLKKVVEYLSFSSEVALLRQRCKVLQNEEVRMLKTVNSLKKQLEDAKHIIKKLIDEKMSGQPWAQGVAPLRVTRSVGLQVCTVGSVNVISTKIKERESLKLLRKRDSIRSPKTVVQTATSTSNDKDSNVYNSQRNDIVKAEDSIANPIQVNTPKAANVPLHRNDSTPVPKPILLAASTPTLSSLPNTNKHETVLPKRETSFKSPVEKRSAINVAATDLIDLTDDSPAVTSSTDICTPIQQKNQWWSLSKPQDGSTLPKPQKDGSTLPKPQKDGITLPKLQKDSSTLPKLQKDGSTLSKPQKDGSTLRKPQKDGCTLPKPQKDVFSSAKQPKDACLLAKQQKDLSSLSKQQKDAYSLPKQLTDGCPLPKQQMGGPLQSKQQMGGPLQPKPNNQSLVFSKSSALMIGVDKSSSSLSMKSASTTNNIPMLNLPKFPPSPQYSPETKKPPRPILRIGKNNSKSEKQGIMLSWNFETGVDISSIQEYQLFAYQENKPSKENPEKVEKPETWKKVGDIKALPLPMACFLTQFVEGHKYHFIVRAVDLDKKLGDFSLPGSIVLHTKSNVSTVTVRPASQAQSSTTTKLN